MIHPLTSSLRHLHQFSRNPYNYICNYLRMKRLWKLICILTESSDSMLFALRYTFYLQTVDEFISQLFIHINCRNFALHRDSGVKASSKLGTKRRRRWSVFPSPPEERSWDGANFCFVISKWHTLVNSEVLNLKFFFILNSPVEFGWILWQILDSRATLSLGEDD